jgi:hypothetical protein
MKNEEFVQRRAILNSSFEITAVRLKVEQIQLVGRITIIVVESI